MDLNRNQDAGSATNRIEEIKSKGFDLDFSSTFNYAFDVYKKMVLMAGLGMLLIVIVFGGALLSVLGLTIGMGSIVDFGDIANSQMTGFFMLIYGVVISVLGGLFAPITAGFLKMAYDGDHNQNVSFGTLFHYYSTNYFKDLFLAGLILSGASMLLSFGFEFLSLQFIGGILSLILTLLTVLAIPLIIFGNMNAVDAILGSVTVVAKNPLMIVGLVIVAYLFVLAGMIALCLGIFFTSPFLYAMIYSIYKHAIGFKDSLENEQIIKSEDYF